MIVHNVTENELRTAGDESSVPCGSLLSHELVRVLELDEYLEFTDLAKLYRDWEGFLIVVAKDTPFCIDRDGNVARYTINQPTWYASFRDCIELERPW